MKFDKTALAAMLAFACAAGAQAQTFELLHSFKSEEGTNPTAPPVIAADGTLYGVTLVGGQQPFAGTLYRLSGQAFAVLHPFGSAGDGSQPMGSPAFDRKGRLVGTTSSGGTLGMGTIWVFDPRDGSYRVAHDFAGGADGAAPFEGMNLGSNGTWYGATVGGGLSVCSGSNRPCGMLFSFDEKTSAVALVHEFSGTDGKAPYGAPVLRKGKLYGAPGGGGTPYVVDKDGTNFTEIPVTDGAVSFGSSLALDAKGTLWGVVALGGTNATGGIFSIKPSGHFHWVFSFPADAQAGSSGVPAIDASGRLYGTNISGGPAQAGQVWRFDPKTGEFVVLHRFAITDGRYPADGVAIDASGAIYGTTEQGGDFNGGTVYAIRP